MSDLVQTITVIASVITGLGVIVGAFMKIRSAIKKISQKIEILDRIEKSEDERKSFGSDLKDIKEDIKQMKADILDLNKQFKKHIDKDIIKEKRAEETLDETKCLRKKIEELETQMKALNDTDKKQREIVLQETRNCLIDKMNISLKRGYIDSMEEVSRLGDLFAAYKSYGGNHGVGDEFERYKKLPFYSEVKE